MFQRNDYTFLGTQKNFLRDYDRMFITLGSVLFQNVIFTSTTRNHVSQISITIMLLLRRQKQEAINIYRLRMKQTL